MSSLSSRLKQTRDESEGTNSSLEILNELDSAAYRLGLVALETHCGVMMDDGEISEFTRDLPAASSDLGIPALGPYVSFLHRLLFV